MKSRKYKLVIIIIIILIIPSYYVGLLIFHGNPSFVCFDLVGGNAPDEAIVRFVSKAINATLDNDNVWLDKVSKEYPNNSLIHYNELFPFIEDEFLVEISDQYFRLYEVNIFFPDGSLHMGLESDWPCPNFKITEDDIDQSIRIINVREK